MKMTKWDLVRTTTAIYISDELTIPKGTIGVYYERLPDGIYKIFIPENNIHIYVEKNKIVEEMKYEKKI